MFYLIVYFILLVLSLLNLQYSDRLSRQMLLPPVALLLIGIAGLRYETGGDWDTYAQLFESFPSFSRLVHHPEELAGLSVEEGFTLLCALVKSAGGNVQHLFFVVTSINILLISSALPRYTRYPVIGLLCYYCILYFQLEMIYIRQATAVALCFHALQYVQDKKFFRFMFFILLACTFHRVAAIMLPLYFVLDRRLPAWVYLAVIGGGALLMLEGVPWIRNIFLTIAGWLGEGYAEKAEFYTEHALFATSRRLSVGYFLNLALLAVFLLFHREVVRRPYGTVMLNMFALSLILYYYCFELVEVSNRMRMFFNIGIIVVLPMLLELLPAFMDRLMGLAVVALYCFSFSQGIFLEAPQAAAYNPYQNYIEYKLHPRPSTGKQRLEQSKKAFRQERNR